MAVVTIEIGCVADCPHCKAVLYPRIMRDGARVLTHICPDGNLEDRFPNRPVAQIRIGDPDSDGG